MVVSRMWIRRTEDRIRMKRSKGEDLMAKEREPFSLIPHSIVEPRPPYSDRHVARYPFPHRRSALSLIHSFIWFCFCFLLLVFCFVFFLFFSRFACYQSRLRRRSPLIPNTTTTPIRTALSSTARLLISLRFPRLLHLFPSRVC